jgi:glycosyltransferase involved in cell wall biosynthesis
MMQSKILIILPAYNESKSIKEVIIGLLAYGDPLVVNDGSSDETAAISTGAGAKVISHKKNSGYDAALETGLNYAIDHKYTYAITFDADGQHTPEDIKYFLDAFSHGAELVLGVRPKFQRFGEAVFSVVGRYIWGPKDLLCGMKAYKVCSIQHIKINTFQSIGTELSIRLLRGGAQFSEVPIKINSRLDNSRFGVGISPNLKILKSLWMVLTTIKYEVR